WPSSRTTRCPRGRGRGGQWTPRWAWARGPSGATSLELTLHGPDSNGHLDDARGAGRVHRLYHAPMGHLAVGADDHDHFGILLAKSLEPLRELGRLDALAVEIEDAVARHGDVDAVLPVLARGGLG